MTETFPQPDFIKPEVTPAPLKDEKYGEGIATVVATLEGLPPEIKDKVPDGYVVKKYKFGEFDQQWSDTLFRNDPEIDEAKSEFFGYSIRKAIKDIRAKKGIDYDPSIKEISEILDADPKLKFHGDELRQLVEANSLLTVAKKLKERETKIRDFFEDTMPELVVPSQFVIGSEMEKTKYLYNLQKRVVDDLVFTQDELQEFTNLVRQEMFGVPVSEIGGFDEVKSKVMEQATSTYAEKINIYFSGNCDHIKNEILMLVDKGRTLINELKTIPFDLFAPGNLKIMKSGLRIIDTNQVYPMPPDQDEFNDYGAESYKKQFEDSLEFWGMVAQKL